MALSPVESDRLHGVVSVESDRLHGVVSRCRLSSAWRCLMLNVIDFMVLSLVPGYRLHCVISRWKRSPPRCCLTLQVIVFIVLSLVACDRLRGDVIASMVLSSLEVIASMVIASMVLSIITSIVAICTVIALAVAISVLTSARTERKRYSSVYYRSEHSDLYTTALVILYMGLFVYQAVVSIWLSAIGCSVSCCGSHSTQVNQPVAMTAPAMAPMHVVQPMQQAPYVVQGAYPASQPQGAYQMNQQQGPGPMLADAKPPL
ncbi:hypothetical protein LSAT2_012539 [Lamellibrachia satsuma]|nr:hypothetical protein LSAT2_012539 [Lamellibrachia satsuma]